MVGIEVVFRASDWVLQHLFWLEEKKGETYTLDESSHSLAVLVAEGIVAFLQLLASALDLGAGAAVVLLSPGPFLELIEVEHFNYYNE